MEPVIKPTPVILLLLFFAAMTGQTFAAEAPMTLGRMAIAGTSNGVCWIGNVLETQNRGFLDKFTAQDVRVQDMAAAASAGLVVSSEVLLSPTIFDANVTVAKHKGAPIEWRPLEAVVTTVGHSGVTIKAPDAHAGLLFLDFLHFKEGQ